MLTYRSSKRIVRSRTNFNPGRHEVQRTQENEMTNEKLLKEVMALTEGDRKFLALQLIASTLNPIPVTDAIKQLEEVVYLGFTDNPGE